MKTLVLVSLLLFPLAAWADSADDLRVCQNQLGLVRQVRDFYEAQLAALQARADALAAELAKVKKPEEPKK